MSINLGLIGFGEAGQTFAAAALWESSARVYDRLTDHEATRAAKEADYRRAGVCGVDRLSSALEGPGLVLSLVTADQALPVAAAAAASLSPGAMFCDMNSVAPATKRAAAAEIEAAGALYVDIAIMSPVLPARLAAPLLLSGSEAETAARRLARLGFTDVRVVGQDVGQASSIKMIRSSHRQRARGADGGGDACRPCRGSGRRGARFAGRKRRQRTLGQAGRL
jgi:3-hydroxyisobutyrate dehydrogenase-like beta-hydroxyacid dehydrogenase